MMRQRKDNVRWGERAARVLLAGVSMTALSACDDLLEVELPHLLTDAAIEGAGTAGTQVNSIIALFECGYNASGLRSAGHEDAVASVAGVFSGANVYSDEPVTGTCDTGDTSTAWLDQINGARALASNDPAKYVAAPGAEGIANGVYDRITGEWSLGQPGERLAALAALYNAMALTHLGEFVCEAAIDGSELLTPTQMLTMGEDWITNRAIGHITAFGDFTMPYGIDGNTGVTANQLALAVRARARWANHNLAGAAADAAAILAANPDFRAVVTRDPGNQRRNKLWLSLRSARFSAMVGVVDFWNPAVRRPNPATGAIWPDPIPHTGYIFLGIMPDGRALEAGDVPVVWADPVRDAGGNPVPSGNGSSADPRVTSEFTVLGGPGSGEVPTTYSSDSQDIPYMTWEELLLIQADNELHTNGDLAAAIAHVNTIRSTKGLPTVSGAYLASLTTEAAVRALLLEERRREFFMEAGRWHSTKIQNTDVLWFPRNEGTQNTSSGYQMLGGVRIQFDGSEYNLNPNWSAAGGTDLQGTGCDTGAEVAADGFGSLGGNPGSQAPVIN